MIRKWLAAALLVLAAAGFITFLSVAVGAWYAKREADQQLNAAMEKALTAGDVAERVVKLVREVIARAKASLQAARADNQPAGPITDPMVRIAVWKAKRELPGEVEKARDAVSVASEAVIVAESLLDVFVEHKPDETALGVKHQDIHTARTQLESAAADLKNARSVLGIPIATATPEQYSQVDQALATATDVTNRVDEALKDTRRKVELMKASADRWSQRLAFAISGLMVLAAAGQACLVRTGVRMLSAKPT